MSIKLCERRMAGILVKIRNWFLTSGTEVLDDTRVFRRKTKDLFRQWLLDNEHNVDNETKVRWQCRWKFAIGSLFENYLRIKILNKITMKYVFLEREQRNRFVLEDLSRVNTIWHTLPLKIVRISFIFNKHVYKHSLFDVDYELKITGIFFCTILRILAIFQF